MPFKPLKDPYQNPTGNQAAPETWLLKHPDGRAITIRRRDERFAPEEISWAETDCSGEPLRKGSWTCGKLCPTKPAEELADLLDRFEAEAYTLAKVQTTLPPAPMALLREINMRDTGAGVGSSAMPRGRWQLAGGTRAYNAVSFRLLDRIGVIDVGDGRTDVVRINRIGRELAGSSRITNQTS